MHRYIYLSVCFFICPSVCLSTSPSIPCTISCHLFFSLYMSVCVLVCRFLHALDCPFARKQPVSSQIFSHKHHYDSLLSFSLYMAVCVFVRLSECLFVHEAAIVSPSILTIYNITTVYFLVVFLSISDIKYLSVHYKEAATFILYMTFLFD